MFVNMNDLLLKAKKEKYAVPHFNINNLEWAKYILEECEELKSPVILGVSEGAVKYMGGYNVVYFLIKGLLLDLNITIPVCLHLDHGSSFLECKKAIDANFSSVMIDVSKYDLLKNIEITNDVMKYAKLYNVTVEAEIGCISNNEDNGIYAEIEDCYKLVSETNICAIAPALGSVHGLYKKKPNLNFKRMKVISDCVNIPLVLHGGTGIPDEQIKKAISCGIVKINVNTELQISWAKAVKDYLKNNNVYDPRKIIGSGEKEIKDVIKNKILLFESNNRI